uniref:Tr-type G domain-containing protein n=1 Tax=Angiostrongylus cantonensis TaxID=6313 RepID=A0A0K0DB41_ANGCA
MEDFEFFVEERCILVLTIRLYAERTRRTRKKFVEPVVVKQTRSAKPVVDVYSDMTAKEISEAVGVNLDSVVDVLVNMDQLNLDLVSEDKPLDKEHILKVSAFCRCLVVVFKKWLVFNTAVAFFDKKPRLVQRVRKKTANESEDVVPQAPPDPSKCVKRPPVVTIMGHVDHGKTTLLDALRNSQIVASEFGGITQHIGAFSGFPSVQNVEMFISFLDSVAQNKLVNGSREKPDNYLSRLLDPLFIVVVDLGGRRVTFLDTPGHAAFAAMRARGAKGADIIVLVVAADDGVPIVVALNKCDKPTADPEALLLQADIMGLKSTPEGLMEGIGKVCTVVVTRGTLRKNAILVGGRAWCRVRTMTNENEQHLLEAGPSIPVRISGWKEDIPTPGDEILEVQSVDHAQRAVKFRAKKKMLEKAEKDWKDVEMRRMEDREEYMANRQKLLNKGFRYGSTLRRVAHKEKKFEKVVDDGFPKLRILLRCDVEGTLEAILNIVETYTSEKCKFQIVDFGVGPPSNADVEIAKETRAIIYLFNVRPISAVRNKADQEGVRIEHFNVIYHLVDALRNELSQRLPMLTKMELVGEGHVLKEFLVSDRNRKKQPVAGVLVDWGNFQRNCVFKFLRGGNVIYEGAVESMKQRTELVSSAATNTEVGIAVEDKSIRFKEGDTVEVYSEKLVPQAIDWYPPGF